MNKLGFKTYRSIKMQENKLKKEIDLSIQGRDRTGKGSTFHSLSNAHIT